MRLKSPIDYFFSQNKNKGFSDTFYFRLSDSCELNAQEKREIAGGGLFAFIFVVAFAITAYFVKKNNPNNVNVDFTPGYQSANQEGLITDAI